MSNIQNPNLQFTSLLSGSIQTINTSTIVNGNTTNTSSTSSTQSDCNIFPVGSTLDPSNYMYDGQTILMVNSTLNQNINTAQAKYYDPTTTSTAGWNFDMQSNNIVNGMYSYSSLLDNEVDLYTNLLPTNSAPPTGKYSLDITNGTNQQALFFSLTSQPYTNTTPTGTPNNPTISNINPGYGNNNSDNFLFTSNYYIQQKSEILIIQLVFTVSNTGSTNVYSSQTNYSYPTLSVIVTNKVITKDVIASMSSNSNFNNSKIKTYTAGPIPLQYLSNGTTFSPTVFSSYLFNNVPVVIAPGYTKVYATMPVIYVPPYLNSTFYYGQSLIGSSSASPNASGGYYIDTTGAMRIDQSSSGISQLSNLSENNKINFGHFVVGVSYSSDYQKYSPYTNIQAEVQIKNIWRSPISIYNSYSSFSVIDMATRQVVVLFGKSVNGGTFLVTNTGTPISSVDSYAVTSLRNFMSIMRGVLNQFDGSAALVDYFINPTTITQVNNLGNYNIQPLIPQPLMDGSITNPLFTNGCPLMYYLFLSSRNSASLSIDPSEQIVFSDNINNPYLGIINSVLCSTGNCKYGSANLTTLKTSENQVFGNSLYVGLQLVNNITYSVLIILPEAMFNYPSNIGNNTLSIYSTDTSIFYLSTSASSSSQFTTSTTVISSKSTTTTPTFLVVPNQGVSKIIISVSNSNLVL
jgi:hypothetical protein